MYLQPRHRFVSYEPMDALFWPLWPRARVILSPYMRRDCGFQRMLQFLSSIWGERCAAWTSAASVAVSASARLFREPGPDYPLEAHAQCGSFSVPASTFQAVHLPVFPCSRQRYRPTPFVYAAPRGGFPRTPTSTIRPGSNPPCLFFFNFSSRGSNTSSTPQ